MYKMFVKYTKNDRMKFISHLELVRVMERAFRRANIPLKFTQGFNPHPIISFSAPLSVGVSSEGEYLTVELIEKVNVNEFMDKMNETVPKGIRFLSCKYIKPKSAALMSLTEFSNYVMKFKTSDDYSQKEIEDKINEFMDRKEIIYKKVSKKNRVKEINIRKQIKTLFLLTVDNSEVILKATVATGSKGNLKPEVLVNKLKETEDIDIIIESVRVHRLETYSTNSNGELIPLEKIFEI